MSSPTMVSMLASGLAGAGSLVAQVAPEGSTTAETGVYLGVGALGTAVLTMIGQLTAQVIGLRKLRIEAEAAEARHRIETDERHDERVFLARRLQEDNERLLTRVDELEAGQAAAAGRLDGQQRILQREVLSGSSIGPAPDLSVVSVVEATKTPPRRVLIVEDKLEPARLLADALTQQGWMPGHAFSVKVTFQKLAGDLFAWVILGLDLDLTNSDLVGLIAEIRQIAPATQIAVLSADPDRLDAVLLRVDGVFGNDDAGLDALLQRIGIEG